MKRVTLADDTAEAPRPLRGVFVRLWSINRWLRWSGVRLVVEFDREKDGPTFVGLAFYGWSFVGHEPAKGRWP